MIDRMECTSYNAFCAKYGTGPTHYGWCAGYIARKLYQPRIVAEVVSVDLELDIIQYREFNMVPVEVVGTFSVPAASPPASSVLEQLTTQVTDLQARLNVLEAWVRKAAAYQPSYYPQVIFPQTIERYPWDDYVTWNASDAPQNKPTSSVDNK